MSTLIYEVTVRLPLSVREQALSYMRDKHISEVLGYEAFSHAHFFHEHKDDGEFFSFTTHYYVQNESLLQNYLDGYAKEMKVDFLKNFQEFSPQIERRFLHLTVVKR